VDSNKMLINQKTALFIFLSIIVASILVAIYFKSFDEFEHNRIRTFITVLGGLGIIITFLLYYNIVALQTEQQETNRLTIIQEINISILNSILKAMNDASSIIPMFVLSLNPLTNSSTSNVPDPTDPIASTTKTTLSYRIFSLWQDYIWLRDGIEIDSIAYLNNFLQRANSPMLHELWLVSKLNFTNETEALGDLLFEYALPITVQVPQSYIDASAKLIADPRYQNIFS
jgi:hypothetical protein